MKIVIFAGGTGRRLWPISRQHSPKQFEPIVGRYSTVQLTVNRVRDAYGISNIYLSTNERYIDILRDQLPDMPEENFIAEPERRDLAAAVGLAMIHLAHFHDPTEPVAIVWGDNYMTEEAEFLELLSTAEAILRDKAAEIVYLGETPRFANNNLGWIEIGEKLGEVGYQSYFKYESWIYRPSNELCQRMFSAGNYVWNTGYFVTTPDFIIRAYQEYQPSIWEGLREIAGAIGTSDYDRKLKRIYPMLEMISFDDAIVKQISPDNGVVIQANTGWSDPGTLYALKESINSDSEANVSLGLVLARDSRDCLLYNYQDGKLLAVVGLNGMVVVNTEDAILVVHKDDIGKVKDLVDGLNGTKIERYS